MVDFSRIVYFTWRVSDCEELEGVTHRVTGDDGVGHAFKNPQSISKIVPARKASVSASKI